MADEKEATTHADLYQRHEQSSENWEEAEAVTGVPTKPFVPNSTLAERAKARQKASTKQVDEAGAEDKAVTSAATKTRAKKK